MEDVQEKWEGYWRERTREKRNEVAECYGELVGRVLKVGFSGRVKGGTGAEVNLDGLKGAGWEGLLKGVEKYDPKRGVKPETYLGKRIRGAILDSLRAVDPLTRRDRAKVKQGEMEEPRAARKVAFSVLSEERGEAFEAKSSADVGRVEMREALREWFGGWDEKRTRALIAHWIEGLPLREVQAVANQKSKGVSLWVHKIVRNGTFPLEDDVAPI